MFRRASKKKKKSDDHHTLFRRHKHAAQAGDHGADAESSSRPQKTKEYFAQLHCLYESKDGLFALFEDTSGHLSAVDTSKLA